MSFLSTATAFYLIGVLTLAAGGKVIKFGGFVGAVRQIIEWCPESVARIIAGLVICAELVIALLLTGYLLGLSSYLADIAVALTLLIAGVFGGSLTYVVAAGRQVACRCFGHDDDDAISLGSLIGPVALAGAALVTRLGELPGRPATWLIGLLAGLYMVSFHMLTPRLAALGWRRSA